MNVQAPIDSYTSGWMQTFSGRKFWPMQSQAHEVFVVDIANALARQCRYGGHCLRFYSVAEHCVIAAEVAAPEDKLDALMHDASEAYIVDVPRPLKGHLHGYYPAEERLAAVIAERYGLRNPIPESVKKIDNAMLSLERKENMAFMDEPPARWGDVEPAPKSVHLRFWSPDQAAAEFIRAFYAYGGRE